MLYKDFMVFSFEEVLCTKMLSIVDGLVCAPGGRASGVCGTRQAIRVVNEDYNHSVFSLCFSAMQEIRQAGEHLSFLVAKSDIHVAMKITASSC